MPQPKNPFLILPKAAQAAKAKRGGGAENIAGPSRQRQIERLQPRFDRLGEAFEAHRVRLREAIDGIAVEQVIVLEVSGSVEGFYKTVRRSGLQWLLELDGAASEPDENFHIADDKAAPVPNKLFLILSDQAAIAQILSLWRRYNNTGRDAFARGFTQWFHVFEQLRDVRLWDIRDRLDRDTRSYWMDRLDAGDETIRTEIELWYSDSEERNVEWANALRSLLEIVGAAVVDSCEIANIQYHAFLADIPAQTIRSILDNVDHTLGKLCTGQFLSAVTDEIDNQTHREGS